MGGGSWFIFIASRVELPVSFSWKILVCAPYHIPCLDALVPRIFFFVFFVFFCLFVFGLVGAVSNLHAVRRIQGFALRWAHVGFAFFPNGLNSRGVPGNSWQSFLPFCQRRAGHGGRRAGVDAAEVRAWDVRFPRTQFAET
jgi:hypothetical protein